MSVSEKVKAYSMTVCDQIRWKNAKALVCQEIEDHLYDQTEAYQAEGVEEESAVAKAITQMGDAVDIGRQLDQIYRPRPQWFMIALAILLILSGAAARYSMYSIQIAPYIVAIGILLLCYFADFTLLGAFAVPFYVVVVAASAVILLTGSRVGGGIYFQALGISVSLAYFSLLSPLAFALFVYDVRSAFICFAVCGLYKLQSWIPVIWPSVPAVCVIWKYSSYDKCGADRIYAVCV